MTTLYNVLVYCGGKCGSRTLFNTLNLNEYKCIQIHNNNYFVNVLKKSVFFCKKISEFNNSFDLIDYSCKNNIIYIIDSYRTPIERKISSFFQNISLHLPNYKELTIIQIINKFNEKYINILENSNPINEVLSHYDIPLWTSFDFDKSYNIITKDNKIFIKILFRDIKNWDKILSEIFEKKITVYPDNLTENKDINNIYNDFKDKYTVPKTYIENVLKNDTEFKIYNTEKEQEEYIKYWLQRSF